MPSHLLNYQAMSAETVLFFQSNSWNHDNLKKNGLFETAHGFGWRIQIIAAPDVSENSLRDILNFWHPLGCVFDCGNRANIPSPTAFGSIPVIYLDCHAGIFGKNANYVSHDSKATIELCARELLSSNFVNLAYVGHYHRQFWAEERRDYFHKLIRAHGLRLNEFAPSKSLDEFEFRQGLEKFLKAIPKPCGLLTVNDEIGEMTIIAANRLHIRIPDELSIISIDNNPRVCETLSPTLSSVEVDFFRSGVLAAELLQRIRSKRKRSFESATFGPIKLIRRASSNSLADCAAAAMTEHIRQNALSPLRAGDVVRLSHGSRRNAEIRFRKATGHSIVDEIHAIRLAKAKELLLKSNYQIAEIVNQCGYSSESYFRKLFRASTGLSPREFRVQHIPRFQSIRS